MFKRKVYDNLLSLKNENQGRYAVLLDGARRVGKTTIITEFVKNEYRTSAIIDFSIPNKRIRDIFEKYASDLDRFFLYIQQELDITLYERNSALVFDEVQAFPLARQLIKHLVADGRYDYYETGSLISLRKNVCDIVIPSEEMRLRVDPMDFEEFMWACGNEVTIKFIGKAFESREPMDIAHEHVMDLFRTYMLVGGMPQAVSAYVTDKSFSSVEKAKRSIIDLYLEDTAKISGRLGIKANNILKNLPSSLSRNEKSFKPSDLAEGTASRDFIDAVNWLEEARLINVCRRCTDPGPAMNLTILDYAFKTYLVDTGLLFSMAFMFNVGDSDEIYRDVLRGHLSINQGMFFENMVAQILVSKGYSLVYSKFSTDDTEHLNEIDFILTKRRKTIPIEVKSGYSGTHKSLDRFITKYRKNLGDKYVIHTKDLYEKDGITYIPIYMAYLL